MRKLNKSEVNRIIKENAVLSNEDLLNKYFDIVYRDVLGSQAEQMEDAGWDESDVKERREYEHYMSCYANILEGMLQERGVDPWKDYINDLSKTCMNGGINIVNIDNVELRHAEVTHFHVDRNTTNEWTGKKPTEWNNDTIMNASFVNSTNAGNLDYVTNEVNKILVKRRRVGILNDPWITLFEIPVINSEGLSFNIRDYFNANDTTYEYALVPVLQQEQSGVTVEVEGRYEVTDQVMSQFDGVFICSRDNYYKLYAGVEYNNLSTLQVTGVHETLGSKYPIVVTNSNTAYRTSGVTGTILNKDYNTTHELNRKKMVQAREELEQFLTDKKPKVIKDWNGNIWLVIFTDSIDTSFANEWGMGLATVNGKWTEIGDVNNEDDLRYAGMIGGVNN